MASAFRPLRPALVTLVALSACGSATPAPPARAPSSQGSSHVAPSAPAAVSSAAPAPAEPRPPAKQCDALAKGLAFGQVLDGRAKELDGRPLDALFPEVAAEGWEVATVVAIEVGGDASARALVLHPPRQEGESVFDARPTSLGVAICSSERGYALAAKPLALHSTSSVLVWDTERVHPRSAPTVTALTLAQGGVGLEFHAAAFVLGAASPPFTVDQPKGEPMGVLGVFGNVAEQFLTGEEGEQYARVDRVEGSGFYPLGDELMYVALRHELGSTSANILGALGPKGLRSMQGGESPSTFAALGKGELPPFCSAPEAAGKVRCARLGLRAALGSLPYDWMAGLWPSAEAAGESLAALGADPKKLDYLALDVSPDADGIKAPNGKRALPLLRAKAPKK